MLDNKTIFQILLWLNACELRYKLMDVPPNNPKPLARSAAAGQRR